MTELDIQKRLFDTFCTLDEYAVSKGYKGEPFLEIDENKEGYERFLNVHFTNVPFEYPDSKRWFELTFRSSEPSDSSILAIDESQYRFTGVFYIDVITEQDVGISEAENKYKWIARLFHEVNIDVIDIMKVYISTQGNEADHYRLQVAIEWEADIIKE